MANYTPEELVSLVSFSVIFVLGSFGNLFVILVYGSSAKRRFMKFERLMLMLGIIDFIASVTNPGYYIYRIVNKRVWDLGGLMCKVVPSLGPLFTNISLGILLVMAIDRDRAVVTPFKKQFTLRIIYKAVATTVVLCIIVTIPYTYHLQIVKTNDTTYCYVSTTRIYNAIVGIMFLTSDLFFLLIFSVTTTRIVLKLKTKDIINCPRTREYRAKETKRIVRLIIAMGVAFVLCVFPRDLFLTSFSFGALMPPPSFIDFKTALSVNMVLKVLHTLNSCVNFILYSMLNRKFRREILRLLLRNGLFKRIYARFSTSKRFQEKFLDSTDTASFSGSGSPTSLTREEHRNRDIKRTETLLKQVLKKPLLTETKNWKKSSERLCIGRWYDGKTLKRRCYNVILRPYTGLAEYFNTGYANGRFVSFLKRTWTL